MTLVVPGASRFTELFDVPHSYTTFANNAVTVKITEDGLQFTTASGGSSPLTTKGDLYTFSTVNTRLPVGGTDGWALLVDSTQPTGLRWGAVAGGSGIARSVNIVSANTNAGATALTDYVYLASGTTTITMPTAVGNTNLYTIKNTGVNTVTIGTTSAQTIDGGGTALLKVQNTSLDLISNGSNWYVI